MGAKPESLDERLQSIQAKLDLMHSDIKKLAPCVTADGREGRLASETAVSPSASAMAIGRGARFNVQRPTLDPGATATAANSSFLPPLAGSTAAGATATGAHSKKVVLTAAKSPEHTDALNNRRKAQAAKQKLQEFLKPMLTQPDSNDVNELANAPCAWLLSIALACSYVSGEKITIEDILRQNRLAMHYVSFPSVTLAELFDVTNEFVEGHPAMLRTKTRCEVVTFDTEAVDESCDGMGAEEQATIRTLSQFRKELSQNEENPMYIINFDPYLIEQHEIRMRLNYTENPDGEGLPDPIKPRWSAKNQGTFALITDFRPALHSVSFGVPLLLEDGRIVVEEHGVPLQTLYNALCVKDGYCNRSRGFVRVFVSERHMEKVPSIFPLGMLDGSLSGGLLMTAVDASIAPHIVGLALMHHLVSCTLLNQGKHRESGVGSALDRGKLRGIPVTKLCQVLNLDIATIVGNSTKVSVCRAFSWYRVFLKKLNLADAVALGVVLINRRGDAADGPVNITDDTFMAHIDLVVKTKSVMLIGFNVNIALNVMVDQRAEPCHFAIVIGFDAEQGVVRLADVSVKKYRKTWNVPLPRLYSAVIGYGYILAAKSPDTISKLSAQQFEDSILSDARYSLPPTMRLLRFEYPKKNYVVTILAEALDTLGFDANVETVANLSGFHTSFMLSAHLPLESAATVARNYSHNHLGDKVSVFTTHMDKDVKHSTPEALVGQILSALEAPKERCLIVNFDPAVIQANREVWNGGSGGPYAIVLSYDKERAVVTLSDANHEAFLRAWVCPLNVLFDALAAVDSISLRARGTLLLTTARQGDNYVGTYGYDMSHSIVHHPFKPSVWPAFHCLALVASEMCGGDGSTSVSGTGQYSSEDFLYTKTTFSVPDTAVASRLDSKEIVDFANTAFERLLIPLEASVVDFAAAGTFFEACRDAMVNNKPITMTLLGYDTQPIHGIPGFSVGVVNRVRDAGPNSTVQVVDGNGCTLGSVWDRKADELRKAVTAMVRIKRKVTK
ncbi:uncharacterized protein TEOVI_000510100 [Trypanosoma equiperdum]|uniref:Uncharacterized protein n=4 Tax=Trypanozoon TaxID=39700 RepID=Q388W4_TRYB2|nr:hypothetical protein, conserved [Trypanosoma brucei gambiense DAL972]XP_823484.1 hypothetical protein, conserved [Trypanosoma brucei brucei TREU927]RHW69904.1 hypothetical protein DPX39_100134400 [Trypanosoma brucei equiperdum]SCU64227.1 hypothetical protein, conserved [Trypanosoma equiperdum]EAN78656.1 hypothetical protein, conserved [Trypanosoma brucei brucei TREU927]CBH16447.1 hypothetical protein, conserved [Trypanosoma brucei gambiense DAL972]|eukprot:XP_011778711.1 hypothetical protein, conserved [Trypanosoma brucei gambiense DAL972]